MTTHDLHDEGALMGVGCTGDGIDCLDDAMQCRVRADGHVSATEIVVYGANLQKDSSIRKYIQGILCVAYQSNDVQDIELLLLLGGNGLVLDQLVQQAGPLLTEQIGAREGAIASNDHQIGDSSLNQVVSGFQATLTLTEVLATGGANDGATTMDNGWDWGPVGFLDAVATIHHALVAFTNEVDLAEGKHESIVDMV